MWPADLSSITHFPTNRAKTTCIELARRRQGIATTTTAAAVRRSADQEAHKSAAAMRGPNDDALCDPAIWLPSPPRSY